jgi:uncharacterized protein YukE
MSITNIQNSYNNTPTATKNNTSIFANNKSVTAIPICDRFETAAAQGKTVGAYQFVTASGTTATVRFSFGADDRNRAEQMLTGIVGNLQDGFSNNAQRHLDAMAALRNEMGREVFHNPPGEQKNLESQLQTLVNAYDKLSRNLNENSESSNKHGKWLDDAFESMVKSFIHFDERAKSDNGNSALSEQSIKKSQIFTDVFFSNIKKARL